MPAVDGIDVQHLDVNDVHLYHRNPRRGDVDAVAESLRVNGQYRAIVVNRGTHTGRPMEVLAGNHTLKAARQLGWETIAAHVIDVDDDQAARIVVADNRTSDLAETDTAIVAELLDGLDDLTGTGYDHEDLDAILNDLLPDTPEPLTDPDEVPDPPAEPITQPGDVWQLGPHRVICGDSTDPATFAALLGDDRADCVWTDPPYGVDYVGKTKDALTIANDGAGGLPDLLGKAFACVVKAARAGAAVYVAHADTARIAFETALREAGFQIRQNLIWVKNTLALGHADYHYKHEPILYANTRYLVCGSVVPGSASCRGHDGLPLSIQ